MPDEIRLSVVIVTFNSGDAIAASLPPLVAQLRPCLLYTSPSPRDRS